MVGIKLLSSQKPSYNSKNSCIQFLRNSKHVINKSTVEVHIRTDTLEYLTFLHNELWCNPLHILIKKKIIFLFFFQFYLQMFINISETKKALEVF